MPQAAGVRVLVALPIRTEASLVQDSLVQGAGAQWKVGGKVPAKWGIWMFRRGSPFIASLG